MDLLARSCDAVSSRSAPPGSNGLMLGEIEILGLRAGETGIELTLPRFLLFLGRSCGVRFAPYPEPGPSCGLAVAETVPDGLTTVGPSEGDGKGARDGVLDGPAS